MLTTFPVSGWNPVLGAPAGYLALPTVNDTTFEFEIGIGSYYVSIWTNAQPPAPVQWYGSYGVNTAMPNYDAIPDIITIDEDNPDIADIDVNVIVPALHYIAGDITFNGTRPAEGLLVMVTTFPVAPPDFPVMGQPTSMFGIFDDAQTVYAHSGLAEGTYYVSLWNFEQIPENQIFYAAYDPDSDGTPDALVINADNWGFTGIDITGETP